MGVSLLSSLSCIPCIGTPNPTPQPTGTATLTLRDSVPDPTTQSGDCLLHVADEPRDIHVHEFTPAFPEYTVHPYGVDVPWLRRQDDLPGRHVQRPHVECVGPHQDHICL